MNPSFQKYLDRVQIKHHKDVWRWSEGMFESVQDVIKFYTWWASRKPDDPQCNDSALNMQYGRLDRVMQIAWNRVGAIDFNKWYRSEVRRFDDADEGLISRVESIIKDYLVWSK